MSLKDELNGRAREYIVDQRNMAMATKAREEISDQESINQGMLYASKITDLLPGLLRAAADNGEAEYSDSNWTTRCHNFAKGFREVMDEFASLNELTGEAVIVHHPAYSSYSGSDYYTYGYKFTW